MKISFICSLFNSRNWIQDYLFNITNVESFSSHELVLVHPESSKDLTLEREVSTFYLKKYPNIKYIITNTDPGIYGCWNLAIENSSGNYISNANTDDRKLNNFIKDFSSEIAANPDYDIFFADSLIATSEAELLLPNLCSYKYSMPPVTVETLIKYNPPHQAPVWKRSIHKKIGYFSDNYGYAGDHEFWLRCMESNFKFKKIDKVCGVYYFNPNGLSTSVQKQQFYSQNIKEKYSKTFNYNGEVHGKLEDIVTRI